MALAVGFGIATITSVYLLRRYTQGAMYRSKRRLDGKTVVVTGGNAGIGKETAIDLAKRGARVIIGCRDMGRGNAAVKEIQKISGSDKVFIEHLDLASLSSVRKFAESIVKNEERLDILINNAGLAWLPFQRTEDGFEMQFGVNHLGHFLLTNLLLDTLKSSASSRIVNVSSRAYCRIPGIDLKAWNNEDEYSRTRAYYNSKLANILFTRELSKRLEGSGVTAYAVHPGVVWTELTKNVPSILRYPADLFLALFAKDAKQGAQTSVYCAVSRECEKESGLYYAECTVQRLNDAALDDVAAKKLWDFSEDLVKL